MKAPPEGADVRVLFISGHTDDALVNRGVLAPGTAILRKPFTPDMLACRVREVLDASFRTAPA
jgi:two-component system, cell cycle sensor histidine kinase and response regulator CckA